MKTLLTWLTSISPGHLLVMVVLGVLLGLQIGPQETELVVLVGAAGLAIPTGPVSSTTAQAAAAPAASWPATTSPTATGTAPQ